MGDCVSFMDAPKVSVIIPTYNREHCIMRAINSVFRQTFQNFDLWVIDDGSTDQTKDLLSDIQDKRFHYLKSINRGVSAARNIGIKESKGEWIALLDSDDEWLPDRLEKQIKIIKENPNIPLIHGEEIWMRKNKRINQKKIHQKFGGDIFERCLPLCLVSPSASLIRRDVLLEVGLFDEDFIVCEDYDLWLKITSKYEVGYVETPLIIKHGGHDDQLSAKYFAMDYYRIKALDRILKIRDLSEKRINAVKNMILRKSDILLRGYIKHNNMYDYDEIMSIAVTHDNNFTINRE